MIQARKPSLIQHLAIMAFVFLFASKANADQPWATSVDGRLFQTGTSNPLKDPTLSFTLQILNPGKDCVLYEETQVYDTNVTNGYFSLKVGSATPDLSGRRTSNDPGYTMARIFNNTLNSFPSAAGCSGGYSPADGDARYLRVSIDPTSGASEVLSPDIALNSVPSAKVAETVGGLSRAELLQVNTAGVNRLDQTNLQSVFNTTQLPILTALLGGTSSLYMRQGTNGAATLPGVSGNATSATPGQIWYDTATNTMKYQSNSGPQTLGVSGAGITGVTAGVGLNVGTGPGGTISTSGTLNIDVGSAVGQIVQVQTGGKLPAVSGADLTNLNGSAINSGTIGGTTTVNTTGTIQSGAITSSGAISGASVVATGAVTAASLTTTGSVSSSDVRTNSVKIFKPSTLLNVELVVDAALSSSLVFTLPTTLGTNGQVLQVDNAGKMSWTTITGTAPGGTAGGDLGGNYPSPDVVKIRGNAVVSGTLAVGDTGKVYRWSGTQFEAVNFGIDDLRTEGGLSQFATNCNSNQTLTWSVITDAFACTPISINANQITAGTIDAARLPVVAVDKGGTGLSALGSTNQVLGVNAAGNAAEYKAITGGAGVTVTHSPGGIQISAPGTGGTVTNVSGSGPIGVATGTTTPVVSISQATTSTDGYLSSADWNTFNNKQAAGNYLVNGGGTPSITSATEVSRPTAGTAGRLFVATDTNRVFRDTGAVWEQLTVNASDLTAGTLPSGRLPAFTGDVTSSAGSNSITLNTVPLTKGGTGLTAGGTGNQVLGMNNLGTSAEYKNIIGGSGVTVTPSAGAITITATGSGGTVTSVSGNGPLSVATGTTTPSISISQANSTTDGFLSFGDWNTFNNKQPAGSYITALTGDVVATGPNSSVATIQANAITTGKINDGAITANKLGALSVTDAKINDVAWGKITGKPTSLTGYGITDNLVINGGGTPSLTSATEASRPAAGTAGRIFVATDTQRIFRDTGSVWEQLSANASDLSAGTLAAARLPAFAGDVTSMAGSNSITLNTVPFSKGGTGLTAGGSSNQVLGMNNAGTAAEYKSIVAGSGVTVTPSAGTLTITATGSGGTVTDVTSANADIGVATTTTTPVLTLNSGTGANQIVKLNGTAQLPAVSGVNLTNLNASNLASGTLPAARLPAFSGDVSSAAGTTTLTLATVPVTKGGTGSTSFAPDQMVVANGAGSALQSFFCPVGNFLKFGASGVAACDTIAGALGYTPANGANYVAKAGDTMTGTLNLASNGLVVGTNQLVVSGSAVGIGTNAPNGSSALEVTSTSKGFLPPRMTKAQRNAITSPAQGLLVFNTDDNTLDYYNGANWLTLNGSAKYIKLGMGVTNQSVNIGTDIAFTAVRASSGMTRSGNGVDLKAGVTYRIEASVDTYLADGGAYLGYSLHNGASYFGNVAYTNEGDQTSWGFKSNILEIYKPATDMTVTVRVADDNIGAGTVHGGWNSNLTVTELVPSGPAGGGGNDNLGNHTASQNIGLGSFWLSGDGGNEGVFVTSAGDVGIGLNNPSERFEVSGKVKATQLCIGADCRSAWPSGAGGTVTQVTSANTDIGVATTTTTPVLTLNTGTGADQILKLNGSGAIPAVSGVNLTNLNPSALSSAVPVPKGGTAATSFSPDQMVIANGAGSALQSFFCPPGNILKFGAGGIAACDTIAGALGYTPANGTNYVAKAGDTMTGTLTLASNGLVVGSNQLVVSGGNVGVGAASSAEKLEVSGAIKLGDAAGTQDGTVRWNGTDFEGRAGGVWKSLTGSSTTSPTAFSVHRNGVDQTVAMATWTKLTWTHENFDTDNTFASSRFTPTKAGRYMFTGQIYCSDNVAHCSGAIYKNGVQLSYNFGRTTSAAPIVSMLVDMNGTTDYVELYAYNPDGTTISGSKTLTYFTGFLTSSTTATNSGSGTANYVPAWTSSTTLGNSPLAISSGNVGIGTTAPNALLALSASSGSSVDFSLNRGTTQQAPPSTYPAADEGRFKFYQGDAGFGFRRYLDIISNGQLGTANSAIRFFTNSGGAAVGERVRIDESGNVGIGTTTPDAKLEVAGPVIRTIAHVAGNASDGTDVGQVPGRVLTVTKARAGTSWRIGWTDGRRAMGGGCRWEIRVDGASCPGGALVFDQHSLTAADPHVVGHVVGYCDGISAGSHQVQIWVNSSPGYSGVDCYTGWQGSRWMLEVEEVN